MASAEDVAASKMLRRELNRRMIDVGQADVRVTHGIAYIRGVVRGVKGGPEDLRAELELIRRILTSSGRSGIKDLVIDCAFRSV